MRTGLYFWFGGTPYGSYVGRYYGFNAFDWLSVHLRLGGLGREFCFQVGNHLFFLGGAK